MPIEHPRATLVALASLSLWLGGCPGGPEVALRPSPISPRVGEVAAQQLGSLGSASAVFVDRADLVSRLDCEERTAGACRITTCAPVDGSALPPASRVLPGEITVRGARSCTIAEDADDATCLLPDGEQFWDPATGGEVTFTALGSDALPAFEVTLDAPRAPVLTAPTTTTVEAARDLEIRWTGADGGMLAAYGGGGSADGHFALVDCAVPASDGVLVVPREALEALLADHPLAVMIEDRELRDVGGYPTLFAARSFLTQLAIAR